MVRRFLFLIGGGLFFLSFPSFQPAHGKAVAIDSTLGSLKGITRPETPGLLDGPDPIVTDVRLAVVLGKALFWDQALGSDGVACATCHFQAGADPRTRNQLDPGTHHEGSPLRFSFEPLPSGTQGANVQLRKSDFPLFRRKNPKDKNSGVLFETDDVVGSAGVFFSSFRSFSDGDSEKDDCERLTDPAFHLGGAGTRRAATRNAPSVINAVFNYRNFWDGRANNIFNGESPFGERDPSAGVFEIREGRVVRTRLHLVNASLASQAVAPPLDGREMSCLGRSLPLIARKILKRRPLANQAVHPNDSVLSDYREASGMGLRDRYETLIKKSFAPRFWTAQGPIGQSPKEGPGFNQMEANFAMFLGLALQLYESTLISDDSPFDSPRDSDGYPQALDAAARRGFDLFQTEVCSSCHAGPNLSLAAQPHLAERLSGHPPRLIDRRVINGDFDGLGVLQGLMDVGFANTSVTPDAFDPGLGALDPFGYPLSFSDQFLATLLDPEKSLMDPIRILPCDLSFSFLKDYQPEELRPSLDHYEDCGPGRIILNQVPVPKVASSESKKLANTRLFVATRGAFKIPSLRNVELTGPYMHNGSLKSLEEVLDFYDRGGNYSNPAHFTTGVFFHGFTSQKKNDLLAFLRSLTDDRVRFERAPFDHPSLRVSLGHRPALKGSLQAEDELLLIPAVGREGRPEALGPLKPFAEQLPD